MEGTRCLSLSLFQVPQFLCLCCLHEVQAYVMGEMLHQAFNSLAARSFYERKHWAIQVQITAESIPQCGLQNMTQTMSSGLLRNHTGFGISYGYSKAVTNHSLLQQGG